MCLASLATSAKYDGRAETEVFMLVIKPLVSGVRWSEQCRRALGTDSPVALCGPGSVLDIIGHHNPGRGDWHLAGRDAHDSVMCPMALLCEE